MLFFHKIFLQSIVPKNCFLDTTWDRDVGSEESLKKGRLFQSSVWGKHNIVSAAESKCNASFCCLELLPFLSNSRPQTDFSQTGAPSMEVLNAPRTSCLCMAIGHQISNSNSDQRQRGREISTPNSLTKITLKS